MYQVFRARRGFHLNDEQAALYGEYLLGICHDGEITADQVVDAAGDPACPIHGWFSWKNNNRQWHLYQARTLLRAIEVSLPNRFIFTRLFQVIDGRYVHYRKVFADEAMGRVVLQDAARKLEGARERFDEYSMVMEALHG